MKKLSKEDFKVGMKVVPDDKTRSVNLDGCKAWIYEGGKEQGFLYVAEIDENNLWLKSKLIDEAWFAKYNFSDVTIYEEKPKIKKSDLKIEIEDLKEEVSNLRETLQALIDEKNKVVIKENKPQFEVGKVYKNKCIFYCTKSGDCETLEAFGFNYKGYWEESVNLKGSDFSDFTEATKEEWLERLKKEAEKIGFKEGVKVTTDVYGNMIFQGNYTNVGVDDSLLNGSFFMDRASVLHAYLNNMVRVSIMENGKWAEIIQEPQFEVGQTGLFWDGDFDEAIKYSRVHFGKLEHINMGNIVLYKRMNSLSYEHFKPINLD